MRLLPHLQSASLSRLSTYICRAHLRGLTALLSSSQRQRDFASLQTYAALASPPRKGKQRDRKGNLRHPYTRKQPPKDEAKPEPSIKPESESLDWGSDASMQPSAALQERLRGLKRSAPSLVTAFDKAELPKPTEPVALAEGAGQLLLSPLVQEEQEVELEAPKQGNVRIKSAEYITSSVDIDGCPAARYPEIAVIGRSNVGKSSLINMLTGRKELALVSKTPGKTQCINHFLINKAWYLVDLPGYGYAKTAKTKRVEWGKFTQKYFKKRETLVNVLLLIDASVPTQNIDLGCAEWLFMNQVPFTLVFTKIDKRKKKCPTPEENIDSFEMQLSRIMGDLPVSLTTSATDSLGKDHVLTYLAQLRELYAQNK